MLVKFKGERTVSRRNYSGCSRCGTGRSSGGVEEYKTSYKVYHNGRLIRFDLDKVVEVDEILGKYLLTRTYRENNETKHSFEEVTE